MSLRERLDKKRTVKQNKSLWLYFELLSEALNDAGLSMRIVLKPEIEIEWTKENIHKYIWKPIQEAQLLKKSTTELTTNEVTKIYETLNRFLGEKFGLTVPFPSQEELIDYDKNSNL